MREIKFRALIKHGNTKPQWEYYSTLSQPWWLDEVCMNVKIIIKDLQYTGLKDKNSKEIYEGDIIQHHYHILKAEIKRINSGLVMKYLVDNLKYALYEIDMPYIEIIGNIYENPELLK